MELNRELMVGMLRRGETGKQILDILNMLTSQVQGVTREQVCEDLGISDCPENEDEIQAYMQAV